MKKLTLLTLLATALFMAMPAESRAFDLKSVLKQAKEKAGSKDSASDGKSGLGSLLGNLLSTDKISVDDLTGSWKYMSPSVKFRSDNVLQKAGGAAATAMIENKIAPYYKTAGIDNMTLTVNADSTFVMKVRGININGTIEAVTDSESDANFVFTFKAVRKINIGRMNTYITKSADGNMDITFDITKLVGMLQKISSMTNSQSLSAASKLLSSYDGVCAGFKVSKISQ